MSALLDRLQQALDALLDHRLRTALSVLGIMIGIAAVIVVNTISRGGNSLVYAELETFGLNSVWVYRDWNNDSPQIVTRPGTGIDNDDLAALMEKSDALGIDRVSPTVFLQDDTFRVRNGNRYANASLTGVGRAYPVIANDTIIAGRPFMRHDIQRRLPVALLAPEVVSKLFPGDSTPLGRTLRIGNRRFTVVGLLGNKSRDFLASIGSAGGENANDRVLIPYTTAQQMRNESEINNLQLEVAEFEQAASTAESVKQLLSHRNLSRYEYESEIMASYIATTDRILGGVAIVGVIAASISLLVGGMGIMNMMGTAVLERTREIGIRKAIGARERDILWQFLFEAALISIVGGVLGLFLGGLFSVLLAWVAGFPFMPSASIIAGAMLVSVLVGVLSGFLPALRAARLHPVQALRAGG